MNEPDNQNKSTTPQPSCVFSEPKGDSSKNRQWLPNIRFSMRTLFIIVTLLCVVLVPQSVKLYQARQQRLAVEWVLENSSKVSLNRSGEVYVVDFNGTQITDAGLEHLKELTSLKSLLLHNTQITDAGLKHLKGLNSLISLELRGTQITDAGLEHLKGLTSLRNLNLFSGDPFSGPNITDAGLEHLKGLTNLKNLNLYGTQITNAGHLELKAALPKCSVIKN
ncbi:MAG: hypothetical protein COA78_14615 [Blastopirellula sp.]|nr:MAG: hypothetical protein COA78_14615 [Blastopirellula sp.]